MVPRPDTAKKKQDGGHHPACCLLADLTPKKVAPKLLFYFIRILTAALNFCLT